MSTRRLAAVLAADVAGYSRLMGADEEGTLERLKALRRDLIDPKIAEHHGRIVKTTGDGLLGEFASAVDAARCAVEIQREMAGRADPALLDQRIELRIGIHVGDIIIEGDDIFGDGVNIAARLEALAESGGVLVSRTVHDQVRDRLEISFEDLGERELKNIARPVHVFRVAKAEPRKAPIPEAALALPAKPSIAVLPFSNMSGDPEQEYFADGIVEDILTGLSRLTWLFVIARNSSFTYKGQHVDVRQVGRELGVRYVLEGSVRKGGERIRVTGQLIEAETGNHLWADRYDRALEDVFAIQDEITESVIGCIQPEVYAAEHDRAKRKPPQSLDAWESFIRAMCSSSAGTPTRAPRRLWRCSTAPSCSTRATRKPTACADAALPGVRFRAGRIARPRSPRPLERPIAASRRIQANRGLLLPAASSPWVRSVMRKPSLRSAEPSNSVRTSPMPTGCSELPMPSAVDRTRRSNASIVACG
jgi:adenylate cyclase